jgi:hypothetical protein
MRTITSLSILVRATGVATLALGVLFWTGHAFALLPLHMALGAVLVLSLWALAVAAALRGAPARLVTQALIVGFVVPLLGVLQTRLVPGSGHWVIQVIHLALGGFAVRLGWQLGAAASDAPAVRAPARP